MSADELRHGFGVDDLARMARRVAGESRYTIIDRGEAAGIAAEAIIGRLYQPGPAPVASELFDAARNALSRERDAINRDRGLDTTSPARAAVRYWAFWITVPGEGFEEAVTDRIAVWQVLRALRPLDAEVLRALATTGDHRAAAFALNIPLTAYYNRLSIARREVRRLWAWPEPPAPLWGRDTRGSGQTHRTVMQGRAHTRRRKGKRYAA